MPRPSGRRSGPGASLRSDPAYLLAARTSRVLMAWIRFARGERIALLESVRTPRPRCPQPARAEPIRHRTPPLPEELAAMITNALTVDVEEYYHAAIFRRGTRTAGPARDFESRVERSVDRLLALLADHGARGTFFVLGEVAALPSRRWCGRIAAQGHEIGCHSDRHEERRTPEPRRVPRRHPAGQGADRGRPRRRPSSAIGRRTSRSAAPRAWAYKILLEEGFRYDSSTYPILHDRYGQPGAPRVPVRDLPRRGGEPDGVPDRHGADAGRELSDRRGRLFPAACPCRADAAWASSTSTPRNGGR